MMLFPIAVGRWPQVATFGVGGGGGGDPDFANVVLLCGFEGVDAATTSTDESASAHTLDFNGDAQIDTAQFKFGASSLLLDGASSENVGLPDSDDWDWAGGEYTAEFWIRFNAISTADQTFFAQWNSTLARQSWRLEYSGSDTNLLVFQYKTAGGIQTPISGSWSPVINTWYHVAACRAGNTLRLFADGVMVASADFSAVTIVNPAQIAWLGAGNNGSANLFNGWMDEVRFTKGVGRYSSDGGFTVPVAAFPRS
jgi:hypothetical protein